MKLVQETYTMKLTREEVSEIAFALEVWLRDVKLPDPISGIVEEPERVELTIKLLGFMRGCLGSH